MSMESCSSGRKLKTSDSFNGQRHQHHIPRTSSTNPRSIMNSEITHPCSCIQNTKLFPFRPPLATATGNITKREFKEEVSFASNSRWNPKPEQLQALEDMYQRGTRAPSAEQIQQIAAYLRRFGKIEGKNVFYWFQNHKARERQKRRRCQTDETNGEQLQPPSQIVQTKDTGLLKRTCFDEVEETNNWAPPSYCSKLSEESVSIHREAAAGRADGWIQCEEREIQQRHATWKMMELSYSPSFHFVNAMTATREAFTINQENESIESQTLQLFPLGSDDNNLTEKEYPKTPMTSTIINTDSAPNQFFEFLPLKN